MMTEAALNYVYAGSLRIFAWEESVVSNLFFISLWKLCQGQCNTKL